MKWRDNLLACSCGLCVGFLGAWITIKTLGEQVPRTYSEGIDNNGDSRPDSKFYYDRGVITQAEHDRNFDGRSDFFEYFENGSIKKAETDDTFDGQLDGWLEHRNGNVLFSKHDTDKNGVPDLFLHFKFGVVNAAVWRPNETSRVVRVDVYSGAVRSKTYTDRDGNGMLDTLVIFDRMDTEVTTETLSIETTPEQLLQYKILE